MLYFKLLLGYFLGVSADINERSFLCVFMLREIEFVRQPVQTIESRPVQLNSYVFNASLRPLLGFWRGICPFWGVKVRVLV